MLLRPGWVVLKLLLILSCVPSLLFAATGESITAKQGEVVLYRLELKETPVSVSGGFDGSAVPFVKGDSGYYALLGMDFEKEKGDIRFLIKIVYSDNRVEEKEVRINLLPASFKVQRLSLPRKMVNLSKNTLKRVNKETKVIKSIWAQASDQKLWEGDFIMPLKGKIQGTFGRKRLINGEPRKSHSGEDISAPEGTEVKATNSGVVVNASEMFFNGKGVFLDHGAGLFSMYFHLSDIKVKTGEHVKKGDIIGFVGSTGRASGPHLHWGIKLGGARVDPVKLTKIAIP